MSEEEQQALISKINVLPLADLPFAELVALQERIAGWVAEKRIVAIAKLEAEAALIGVTINGKGAKHKRRRRNET